jgi:hypothetical protein
MVGGEIDDLLAPGIAAPRQAPGFDPRETLFGAS